LAYYIVMIGQPGAGKGTQAEILSEKLGLAHVSTGAIFRENINNKSDLGNRIESVLSRGDLVPDDITNSIIMESLNHPENKNGVVLDGFPRTAVQAQALDDILAKLGGKLDVVPYIYVPEDVLVARLSGRWTCRENGHIFNVSFNPPKKEGICDYDASELYQRDDDRRETVEKRIKVYFEQTEQLIDHYREQGTLLEINGDQEINLVTADLLHAMPETTELL